MPDRPEFDGLDPELLGRYLASECSEEETAQVRRWLMAHPDAAQRLRAYLEQLDRGASRPPTPDVDAEWRALQARLRAHDGGEGNTVVPHGASATPAAATPARASNGTPWYWRRIVAAAAGLVLAAGLGYG